MLDGFEGLPCDPASFRWCSGESNSECGHGLCVCTGSVRMTRFSEYI